MRRFHILTLKCLALFSLATMNTFGASASLIFTKPSGGETYAAGQIQPISLKARPFIKQVIVEFSTDGGATFSNIAIIDNTVLERAQKNTFAWKIQSGPSTNCVLKATASTGKGDYVCLSAPFIILPSLQPKADANVETLHGVALRVGDGKVHTEDLANSAVTTPKIADNAVTANKIGSGAHSSGFILTTDGIGGSTWSLPAPAATVALHAGNSLVAALNDPFTTNQTLNAGVLTGTAAIDITGNAASATTVPDGSISNAKISDVAFSKLTGVPVTALTEDWHLTGNAGTGASGAFLGTTDNALLELRANNITSLLLVPNDNGVNVLGGSGQAVTPEIGAATISGGKNNSVLGEGGTVAGGSSNSALYYSVVAGGQNNASSGGFSAIGGGANNSALEFGAIAGGNTNYAQFSAAIGGGTQNSALGNFAAVAGGNLNTAQGSVSSIGGGESNNALGVYSTIGGGSQNSAYNFATVSGGASNNSSGEGATIAGGVVNSASGVNSFIGGGRSNSAVADESAVSGGANNSALGLGSAIGGGASNNIIADAEYGTISGGLNNSVDGRGASIGGGRQNSATGFDTTVAGGKQNVASLSATIGGGVSNRSDNLSVVAGGANNIAKDFSSIAGGTNNTCSPGTSYSFIGGGQNNLVAEGYCTLSGGFQNTANGFSSTIAGGYNNTVTGGGAVVSGGTLNGAIANASTVAGGEVNSASAPYTTISGGSSNLASATGATTSGGQNNVASGEEAVVTGGTLNNASGLASSISGGFNNSASGDYSSASGRNAAAVHSGSFVWADNTAGLTFSSNAENEFAARATGGVRFVTAIDGGGAPTAGVSLSPGDTSWSVISDKNAKKNIVSIDGENVLAKIAVLPVTQWNYKWETDVTVPHVGPMAQDFKSIFFPGRDEKRISTLEFDGIEMASIKALEKRTAELRAENKILRERLDKLEKERR